MDADCRESMNPERLSGGSMDVDFREAGGGDDEDDDENGCVIARAQSERDEYSIPWLSLESPKGTRSPRIR